MNGASVELYRARSNDGLIAEDNAMGPYLVRYPKTLRAMAPVLAVMKLRRVRRSSPVAIDTGAAGQRRSWKIAALCLSGIVAFGICAAGYNWQVANQRLAVRNRRLEALVEVLRERKANSSVPPNRAAARP